MRLVWLKTSDLRIEDNAALYHAAAKGLVIAVFVVTDEQYRQHDDAEIKQDFWWRNLVEISKSLDKLNIPLKVIYKEIYDQIPEVLFALAKKHRVTDLYFNQQYEVNETKTETAVTNLFDINDIKVHNYIDQTIFAPGSIRTGQGNYYTVFTPFKKNFLKAFKQRQLQVYAKPKKQKSTGIKTDQIQPWLEQKDIRSDLWPAGEMEAKRRLKEFITARILDYKTTRDIPSVNGTSILSPYLAAGVLSIRQCFLAIEETFGAHPPEGAVIWQSELIWREFYKHILVGFPKVAMHQPFKEKTNRLVWKKNDEFFQAWQEGKTGIPIVDAAMRQLNQTGWMHNRLRMVTAMFLSKNLFLDWRLGEQYFMQKLVDGDLAANNGGWQWSASTGTDAAPYFRIFNPVSQSQRFDPEGKFIRKFVPELSDCDNKSVHNPWGAKVYPSTINYPKPIVDLKMTRQFAIEQFKNLV